MTGDAVLIPVDDIFAIPIDNQWLLFSPHTWTSALVNHAAVKAVARCASGFADETRDQVRQLYRHLSSAPVLDAELDNGMEKLVIIPTRGCNMSCVFCDFAVRKAPSTVLDPRLACALFDYFTERLEPQPSETLRVHFFGGEPLVARECVETVIHYVRATCARLGATPFFEVTTNGVFDATLVPFLGDYIDSLVISLDGNAELHDRNRRTKKGGGTFQTVAANINKLSEYPVDLSIRMCITNYSVDNLERVVSELCSKFAFQALSFEMMIENETAASAGLSEPDPYKFAAGILKAEMVASKHGIRVIHGPSELIGPRHTSCPLGRRTLMLNPDGRVSACYLDTDRWTAHGLDLNLGRVDLKDGVFIDQNKVDAVSKLIKTKPRCERCFCRYTCAGGCHIDLTPPGCSPQYDDRCRAIRLLTAGRLLRNLEGWEAVVAYTERQSSMQLLADLPDDRLMATITPNQPELL